MTETPETPNKSRRKTMPAILLPVFLLMFPAVSRAFVDPGPDVLPNFDVRLSRTEGRGFASFQPAPERAAALARLEAPAGDAVRVTWDPASGTPAMLHAGGQALWRAAAGPPEKAALAFVARFGAAFGIGKEDLPGLRILKNYQTQHNGVTHVVYGFEMDGLPVFLSSLGFHFDRNGNLALVTGPAWPMQALTAAWTLSPDQALRSAAAHVGRPLDAPPGLLSSRAERVLRFERSGFRSEPTVTRVIFPLGTEARPAYRVLLDMPGPTAWYQVVVDAATGQVLHRYNLYQYAATQGLVFKENPVAAAQEVVSFPDSGAFIVPESPAGWAFDTFTIGNNVDAKDDIAADNEGTIGARAQASGDPLYFNFPFMDDPNQDLNAALTTLFYGNNFIHDYLYALGFDEAAGNFQVDNFGRPGLGSDSVYADGHDGGGWNNANFGTPPDGDHPRMQMFLWNLTTPNRDGCFDVDVIYHEFGHGVSNRLVGGGVGCMGTAQAGAMGEGWCDFFALTVFDDPIVGEYVVNNFATGIRRASYEGYPYHYGNLCNSGYFQVHADGEIWAAVLWDLRKALIAKFGYDVGKCQTERLVIDGMKFSPCNPVFLDMRDSILLADRLNTGGINQCTIWQVFAAHGMGINAVRSFDCTDATMASFDAPADCATCAAPGSAVVRLSTPDDNQVLVEWDAVPGATSYAVFRGASGCGDGCAASPFEWLGNVAAPDVSYLDQGDALSGGLSFSYRVAAASGSCVSAPACGTVTAEGPCTLKPEYPWGVDGGAVSVMPLESNTCALSVEWLPALPRCSTPLVYNVYRGTDPAFTPDPMTNLVAAVPEPATSFFDQGLDPLTVYFYIVRAEDRVAGRGGPGGGNEEQNVNVAQGAPLGTWGGAMGPFSDSVESGELPRYRRTGSFIPNDWAIVLDTYTAGQHAWHCPGAEGGDADKNLVLPPFSPTTASVFSFRHTYDFEDWYDGGVVEISTDGGRTWIDLLDNFTQGGYSTCVGSCRTLTVSPLIQPPNTDQLWTGQNPSGFGNWDTVSIDLAPYAAATEVQIRLRYLLDAYTVAPGGWYVDDLMMTETKQHGSCVPGCPADLAVDFSIDPQPGCADAAAAQTIHLAATAGAAAVADPDGYHWTLPAITGGPTAAGRLLDVVFPPATPAGSYPVSLRVFDASGCEGSVTRDVVFLADQPVLIGVGNTLLATKDPGAERLFWADTAGTPSYGVHVADVRTDVAAAPAFQTLQADPAGTPVTLGPPGPAGIKYFQVRGRSHCGSAGP